MKRADVLFVPGVVVVVVGLAIGLSRPIGRRNERRNFSARPGGRLVHLCVLDSGIGRATLALRDYLRDPPAERDAYAIEKDGWPRCMWVTPPTVGKRTRRRNRRFSVP